MNKKTAKKLERRKKKLAKRVKRRNWDDQPKPMLNGYNIHYEIDGKQSGISQGGIGVIHQLSKRIGLTDEIDSRISLLKRHLPYHESDHILNIAYNLIAGGKNIEDIELLRGNEAYLDALGAKIIPDPTTAGDYLRRYDQTSILELMEVKNAVRKNIWNNQPENFKEEAVINVDGTICPTWGECKQGMDISYNGQWGYHPLIISLSHTREPLYIVNRSGNAPSHLDSPFWIDKSLDLICDTFKKVKLRGDTDFSLTGHFDKWDKRCTFVFGTDARKNLIDIAEAIKKEDWDEVEKESKYKVKTKKRKRPAKVKDEIVRKRKFKKIQTESEFISEFEYRPGKCGQSYRMIVLKKNLEVVRGDMNLFPEVRYFFYITNDWKSTAQQLLQFYRERADHENDIEQLKNGAKALHAPSNTLESNWAYMVIASLAWDLKAWYGLLMPYRHLGLMVLRMEFKKFVNTFINIPCLIIKTGRKICYRIIGYNNKLKHIIEFSEMLKKFAFT